MARYTGGLKIIFQCDRCRWNLCRIT